jgi:SAM-dependent methyltransferase
MKADAVLIPPRQSAPDSRAKPIHEATPDFDPLAPIYRWMEWCSFGPFLQLCRCTFLRELQSRRRALIIGDGDGRFTARLFEQNRAIRVDAVDASTKMLRALEERSKPHSSRLRTVCADARLWQADFARYDLVVTHFFLDCLTTGEVIVLAKRMREAAAPGAAWVVSEFAIPEGWFGRFAARPLIRLLYLAFRWMTRLSVRELPDYSGALRDCGFQLKERRLRLGGLLTSELWEMQPTQ